MIQSLYLPSLVYTPGYPALAHPWPQDTMPEIVTQLVRLGKLFSAIATYLSVEVVRLSFPDHWATTVPL